MYFNRDLSWLEFNHRVLLEAADTNVPLFERLKFLSICSSNLDEFFSIRYPVILAISRLKSKTQKKIKDDIPLHLLEKIQQEVDKQQEDFRNVLTTRLIPELADNGIILYYDEDIRAEHVNEVREIFLSKVLSFVQPVFLEGDISDKIEPEANKLYMVISLKKHGSDEMVHSMIKVPSDKLKRFFRLSSLDGKHYVIFIDDIIRANCQYIFPGFEVTGIYSIMLNRNAELQIEEDYQENIIKKIEKQLAKRAHGRPSRFLCQLGMPRNSQLYVASLLGIESDEIFEGGRYQSLKDLASFPSFGKDLYYNERKPLTIPDLIAGGDIFKIIEQKDLLLHFPYHSYNPILSFFNQAAIDPEVNEIAITLYRVAADSLIANALISAAKNGKRVTVFIELQARFDEANNIVWSRKMKRAGIRIIYSIPGIKVHTKIALVTKKNEFKSKAYALISTGNFNEITARAYTDHTLLTTDKMLTSELQLLFDFLKMQKIHDPEHSAIFEKVLVSRFNMVDQFSKLIDREIKRVKHGKGLIRIKVNNLEEKGMIDLLYKASTAGVKIQLIVRSICCLLPGIEGISQHIEVKRIVDRHLEHSRIFIFGEDKDADIIMGSADWMTRNLYHRIEVCTPVTDPRCRKELLDYFELQWKDGREIRNDSAHENGEQPLNAQQAIYEYLKTKQ